MALVCNEVILKKAVHTKQLISEQLQSPMQRLQQTDYKCPRYIVSSTFHSTVSWEGEKCTGPPMYTKQHKHLLDELTAHCTPDTLTGQCMSDTVTV
jgi:hypothetical protein